MTQQLEWGQVGQHEWCPLTGHSLEEGVVRTVMGGVVYEPPPQAAGLLIWRQVPANPQRFEMSWAGDPRKVYTLNELARKLHEDPPKANDPRLSELDQVVDKLLRCAAHLHQENYGLGLLNPRNVLIVPRKEGAEILLPDWGFTWTSGPVKPDWLKANEFKDLWDQPPHIQQHVKDGTLSPDEQKKADLRALARLFACLLTGTPQRDVADFPPEASKHHQKENPDVLKQVWGALAEAFRGDIKTATEFADRLKRSPLSGHFIAVPAPPRVTSLNIKTGPAAGGTSVTLTGDNFLRATGVSFGDKPATKFTINSPTQITATSPPHDAATVDVTVTTPSGKSISAENTRFTYEPIREKSPASTAPVTRDTQRSRKPLLPLVIGGSLVVILLLALFIWKPWGRQQSHAQNGKEQSASFDSLLKKFADAKDEDKAAILSEMWREGSAKEEDKAKREKLRGEFLIRWKDRLRQVEEEYFADHRQKFESRKKVETLRNELKMLRERPAADTALNGEEQQCLTFAELLLGQF